jgi:hypothetical protein
MLPPAIKWHYYCRFYHTSRYMYAAAPCSAFRASAPPLDAAMAPCCRTSQARSPRTPYGCRSSPKCVGQCVWKEDRTPSFGNKIVVSIHGKSTLRICLLCRLRSEHDPLRSLALSMAKYRQSSGHAAERYFVHRAPSTAGSSEWSGLLRLLLSRLQPQLLLELPFAYFATIIVAVSVSASHCNCIA